MAVTFHWEGSQVRWGAVMPSRQLQLHLVNPLDWEYAFTEGDKLYQVRPEVHLTGRRGSPGRPWLLVWAEDANAALDATASYLASAWPRARYPREAFRGGVVYEPVGSGEMLLERWLDDPQFLSYSPIRDASMILAAGLASRVFQRTAREEPESRRPLVLLYSQTFRRAKWPNLVRQAAEMFRSEDEAVLVETDKALARENRSRRRVRRWRQPRRG